MKLGISNKKMFFIKSEGHFFITGIQNIVSPSIYFWYNMLRPRNNKEFKSKIINNTYIINLKK
jgi:hypothetical protein